MFPLLWSEKYLLSPDRADSSLLAVYVLLEDLRQPSVFILSHYDKIAVHEA